MRRIQKSHALEDMRRLVPAESSSQMPEQLLGLSDDYRVSEAKKLSTILANLNVLKDNRFRFL